MKRMSPPRKYPIPNQDINMIGTRKYQILPPQLSKFHPNGGQKIRSDIFSLEEQEQV